MAAGIATYAAGATPRKNRRETMTDKPAEPPVVGHGSTINTSGAERVRAVFERNVQHIAELAKADSAALEAAIRRIVREEIEADRREREEANSALMERLLAEATADLDLGADGDDEPA